MVATLGPAKGALFIHGGGPLSTGFKKAFRDLAGGPDAPFVCIPTAFSDSELGQSEENSLGFSNPFRLHTRKRTEAETEAFVSPLLKAHAVYIDGGRQWRLADSYLNTKTHRELNNLLDRGGIIAGSSAGATIQGSFLVRGDTANNSIMIGDHQEGFGFIQNVAIDQHITEHNRRNDLAEVLKVHPTLLGIGIAERAAILVSGDYFMVLNGYVLVHDGPPPYRQLNAGQRFKLSTRQVAPTTVP